MYWADRLVPNENGRVFLPSGAAYGKQDFISESVILTQITVDSSSLQSHSDRLGASSRIGQRQRFYT